MDDESRVAPVEDVPDDGTLLFRFRNGGDVTEAILARLDDGSVVAFENYCPHWVDVRLDKGSGATVRNGELICQKHGATFEKSSGCCDFGPCKGATLATVDVTVEDGAVYLDDSYEFVGLGPDEDRDRSSSSRIGFSG
ncbi:Rieske (2Fe-2S) protein [Haloplanus sp. GCM10025708]|uniref:Rieske (2Fe-2S) protein n=1 Tax=Haloferacaceae TaxID=1644056 RepID=UPI00361CCB03